MYVSSHWLPVVMRPDPYSIRVLYMPPVYAIISFFSYRFFRSYTYYSLIEIGALHPCCLRLTLIPFTVYEVCLFIFCRHTVRHS